MEVITKVERLEPGVILGDGGMIVTNSSTMAKKLKSLSFHGWDKDPLLRHKQRFAKNKKNLKKSLHWYYEIKQLGYKYNMNDSCSHEQLEV